VSLLLLLPPLLLLLPLLLLPLLLPSSPASSLLQVPAAGLPVCTTSFMPEAVGSSHWAATVWHSRCSMASTPPTMKDFP
jgi:hypothetical protein